MTAPREVCMGTGERRVVLGIILGGRYYTYGLRLTPKQSCFVLRRAGY